MVICMALTIQLRAQGDAPLKLLAEEDYTSAPDSSFLLLKKEYNRALEKKDPIAAARTLQRMGQLCFHLGHYPQSLDYHLQAGDIFRQQGQKALQAANLNDIGLLYFYNKQEPLACQQYEAAYAIYNELHDQAGTAATFGNIGHLYEKEQQYDSAFYFQRQALHQYTRIDDKKGSAKIYENLGSIHEDLEKYDSAQYYFSKALELNDNNIARIEILNNMGDVLRKTGHYQEGIAQTRKALILALETNEQHQLSGAYRDLAKSYNLMGMHDSAYYYLELSRKYLLDTYSDENSKQVALLQTVYDIEKKNSEIERLVNTRKTTRIITVAIVVVVLLLVVLGLLIISRQRLKIKNERMESLQHRHKYETAEVKLKEELETKSKELSTYTLHIIQKNQLLEDLRNRLDELIKDDKRDQKKQLKQILTQINASFNHDEYWVEFRNIFEQVHQSFFTNLKNYCDTLTPNDLRLVALLKMNMGSNDIATLLGISQDSLRVVRYRLRKKLNLAQGESLTVFLQSL